MTDLSLGLETILASALLVAASQKFLEFTAWRGARVQIAPALPRWLWQALPGAELLVGVGLAIGYRPWAAAAAVALFGAFALVLAFAYRNGVRSDCNCFGAVLPTKVGPVAIARATALAAASVLLLAIAEPLQPVHLLGVSVPLAVAAVVALYGAVRPLLSGQTPTGPKGG